MIRTKSCRCVMLRVTSLWIRLTRDWKRIITSLWTHTLSYLPHSHRTYTPNKVISLGLQTLNPQQNYFSLKTQTSDYHYPETSEPYQFMSKFDNINLRKHDKNDHDTTLNTRGDLISRVNHRYIAFLDRADKHNLIKTCANH